MRIRNNCWPAMTFYPWILSLPEHSPSSKRKFWWFKTQNKQNFKLGFFQSIGTLEGKQSTFLWTFLSYSVTLGFNLPLVEETYHHRHKPLYFQIFPWLDLFLFSVLFFFLIKMTWLHLNVHSASQDLQMSSL